MIRATVALLATACAASCADGYLKVKASPSRAGVFVDGKYIGPAGNLAMARKYAVAAGEHEIKLVEPRCQDVVKKVTISEGKTTTLRETLPKLPPPKGPFGQLRTPIADKYAAVYINGKYMGHADEFNAGSQGLLLPEGEYTVRIAPSSGQPIEKKVTLKAGSPVAVTN